MNTRLIVMFLLVTSFLAACLPQTPAPTLPPATQPQATEPSPSPVTPPASETAQLPSASGWVEYRDARYGYGLALPCYWTVYPTPSEGMFATLSAHSYSEQFHAANSERGEWKGGVWPAGALKLDATVVEGIDPSLSLEDGIRYLFTTPSFATEQSLVSLEEKTFGAHQAFIATVQGGLQGAETVRQIYFQLQPGAVLIFHVLPQQAFAEPDFQAILGSYAAPGEEVAFPSQAPSGPPEGDPVSCQ